MNFVAIKNGMHSGKGFLYFDDINENQETKINQKLKINQVKEKIFEYFTN